MGLVDGSIWDIQPPGQLEQQLVVWSHRVCGSGLPAALRREERARPNPSNSCQHCPRTPVSPHPECPTPAWRWSPCHAPRALLPTTAPGDFLGSLHTEPHVQVSKNRLGLYVCCILVPGTHTGAYEAGHSITKGMNATQCGP